VVVQAEPGTAMPTATVQYQADQAVVQPHQAMAAALQITDIETFQQTEHRDKDSQAVRVYDSTNKVRIYTLLAVVAELVDQVHVHQIIAMTEK
jgi:energy-coupling factor transporter transmembrane protein EcfT